MPRPYVMRISVDLTPTLRHGTGVGRYAAELARALAAQMLPDEQIEVFYLDHPDRRLARDLEALAATRLARSPRLWRVEVALAHVLPRAQDSLVGAPDVFIATDFLLPYLPRTKSIFILHDLTYHLLPSTHSFLNRLFLTWAVPRFLQAATVTVTVSSATQQDAVHIYGWPSHRLHIVYPGVSSNMTPVTAASRLASIRERYHLPERFVLTVSTLEPRKNLATLLAAWEAPSLEIPLVIAGRPGWKHATLDKRIQTLAPRVRRLGFVPDEDLAALYSAAEAFAFPSLYEGFGLPVLEAMACGTPALCSNTSSLTEVAGGAALLLPPMDEHAWVEALQRITADPELRADLRARGLAQAQRFSWARAAQQFRQLYRGQEP